MIKVIELQNGLRIILDRRRDRRSLSFSVWVKSGKRDETDGSGISHFIEHELFLGSIHYPSPIEIAGPIERAGGNIGAGSGAETTVYYSAVPYQEGKLALMILMDILMNPLFDEERIETEKKVILSEMEMYNEDSERYLNDILVPRQLWSGHPLGESGLGAPEQIRAMTRERLSTHHKVFYNPANMVFSVAGRFDEDEIVDLIEGSIDGRKPLPVPERMKFVSRQKAPDIRFEKKNTQQTFLTVSLRGPSYTSRFVPEMELLNLYLADGMSSVLFEEVRNRRGLAYDISSDVQFFEDCGILYISAETDPGNAGETFRVIAETLYKKLETGFSEEETAGLKRMYLGSLQMRLEDLSFKSSWMASRLLRRGTIVDLASERRKIERVTPSRLDRMLSRLLSPENWNVYFLGPAEKIDIKIPV